MLGLLVWVCPSWGDWVGASFGTFVHVENLMEEQRRSTAAIHGGTVATCRRVLSACNSYGPGLRDKLVVAVRHPCRFHVLRSLA